jgi:endonuclease YncB( thermonuclease family)
MKKQTKPKGKARGQNKDGAGRGLMKTIMFTIAAGFGAIVIIGIYSRFIDNVASASDYIPPVPAITPDNFNMTMMPGIPNIGTVAPGSNEITSSPEQTVIQSPIQSQELYQNIKEQAIVHRIIDGDTFEAFVNSNIYRIRLIGIDAPEMGFFGGAYEEGATGATEFVNSLMPTGSVIYLQSQGADTDRFGRLRRIVWIEGHNKSLNDMLLYYGYAVRWP